MYHVSAQGVDEHMINVHYYYYERVSELIDMKMYTWSIRTSRQNHRRSAPSAYITQLYMYEHTNSR